MEPPVPGDPDRPSPARTYDAVLGGHDNWQADRNLAARMRYLCPGVEGMARANRLYLAFAVMQARNAGIRQFIDLGSGFPGAGSVLDVAKAHDPDARIVAVDIDEEVAGAELGYGPLLEFRDVKNAAMVLADARDPDAVLGDEGTARLIDLSEPACVTLGLVAHYWRPQEAREVVAGYVDALAPGSAVVVTVSRGSGDEAFGAMKREWEAATGGIGEDYGLGDLAGLLAGLDAQGEIGPVTGVRAAGPCGGPHVAGGIALKRS